MNEVALMPTKIATENKAIDAFMAVIARRGWPQATLDVVAAEAGMPLSDMLRIGSSRFDLLEAFGKRTDCEAVRAAEDEGGSQAVRDRLFALVMGRLDALDTHKAAIKVLMKAAPADLGLALFFAREVPRSMALLAEAAGVSAAGPLGAIRAHGLAVLYLSVVRVWLQDDSEDQGPTLKALDKNLATAETWGSRLAQPFEGSPFRRSKARTNAPDRESPAEAAAEQD